jgi:hypothetical protein
MMLGSYEVLLCIARGGMACVWAARQHGARGFNRLVALKTVLPEFAEPELEGMFLDEARVAARVHHPNVCEIFELVEHEGVLALSMEWVDGDTLNGIVNARSQQPLDPRVAAFILAQVACGLHAAHELVDENGVPMQLVHRDVSPQNILISRAGHVKVADFGVAKALGGSREETAIGKVKGKLSYMSPEQAEGNPVDRRSDIFALGVVLYLATVGAHPFRMAGETREQQLMRLIVGSFTPPSAIVRGYPRELEAIVLRAMSSNPAERFATADEMRCRLQEWLMRSGPLLTEQHIAQVLSERVGPAIVARAERIQRCVRASRRVDKLDVRPTGSGELTFVPTTSGIMGVATVVTVRPRRRATRAAAAALALALCGLLGTLALTGDGDGGGTGAAAADLDDVKAAEAPRFAPRPYAADELPEAPAVAERQPSVRDRVRAELRGDPIAAGASQRRQRVKTDSASTGASPTDASPRPRNQRADGSDRDGARRAGPAARIGPLEKDL